MSGTYERSRYDEDAYAVELQANDKRVNYMLADNSHCKPCRIPDPGFLAHCGVSVNPDMSLTDVESELLQLTRKLSRCPDKEYKPMCPNLVNTNDGDGLPCGGGVTRGPQQCQPRLRHLPECQFTQIESRSIAPACTLRGTGWDRWEPLCQAPQDLAVIEFPGESNVNMRQALRDSFKPCFLKPWDQTAAFPLGGELPCQPLSGSTCAVFTSDLQPTRYSQPFPAGYK